MWFCWERKKKVRESEEERICTLPLPILCCFLFSVLQRRNTWRRHTILSSYTQKVWYRYVVMYCKNYTGYKYCISRIAITKWAKAFSFFRVTWLLSVTDTSLDIIFCFLSYIFDACFFTFRYLSKSNIVRPFTWPESRESD